MLNKHPWIYTVFELEALEILTKEDYDMLSNLLKSIVYPKMLRFKSLSLAISTIIKLDKIKL